ncbi:hypothetical protein HMPREF0307_02221 [Corynebacterium sp. DNF00584]|nr:hypothetical protein HMPREF0307_02221 [Corynebacterium sp. DNF00584]OFL79397.1 hypothetical protein HMPREF2748_10335 [Corynebacterium sp. HMSC077B05]
MLTLNLTNKKAKEVGSNDRIEVNALCTLIEGRDSQLDNPFSKEAQVNYIRIARGFFGDKVMHTAPPHRLLNASKGPLIAVPLKVLTRKTLGGIGFWASRPK